VEQKPEQPKETKPAEVSQLRRGWQVRPATLMVAPPQERLLKPQPVEEQ
jgi:hypothetical protein